MVERLVNVWRGLLGLLVSDMDACSPRHVCDEAIGRLEDELLRVDDGLATLVAAHDAATDAESAERLAGDIAEQEAIAHGLRSEIRRVQEVREELVRASRDERFLSDLQRLDRLKRQLEERRLQQMTADERTRFFEDRQRREERSARWWSRLGYLLWAVVAAWVISRVVVAVAG